MAPLPTAGTVIAGRFRIDERVGAGGMGVVYRATQLGLGRPVAVKVMRLAHGSEAESLAQARFEREARVASALRHKGAVQIIDFGVDDGSFFLVMELLLGESLHNRVVRGALSLEQAVLTGMQLAEVLEAAHDIGLVHRDLKPANVILEPAVSGEQAKLLDFGLAFIADAGGDLGRVTSQDVISGTPEYVSPEQAMGRPLGPPSDIYALGCVLYEMFTGEPPFVGAAGQIVADHLYKTPPPLPSRLVVDASLHALLQSMLAKDAARRPSAREVGAALARLQEIGVAGERRAAFSTPLRSVGVDRTDDNLAPTAPTMTMAVGDLPLSSLASTVGLVSEDPSLETSLALNGFRVVVCADVAAAVAANVDVVFAPAAVDADCKAAVPVVAASSVDDMARMTALLRAGARDVVVLPIDTGELARKLRRALKR